MCRLCVSRGVRSNFQDRAKPVRKAAVGAGCSGGTAGLPRCPVREPPLSARASPAATPAGCPTARGASVTNTAAGTARASGSEAFGDYLGQERGGRLPRTELWSEPAAGPAGSGAGAVWGEQADAPGAATGRGEEGPAGQNRPGPSAGGSTALGEEGRGEAAPSGGCGQPHREDLKQPFGRDGSKGCWAASELCWARAGARPNGGSGPASGAAVGAGVARMLRARHVRQRPVERGGRGRRRAPRAARNRAPAPGPELRLPALQSKGTGPRVSWRQQEGFLSGEAPGRSPGRRLRRAALGSPEAAAAPTSARGQGRAAPPPHPRLCSPRRCLLGPATRGCVVAGRGQATQNHKRTNKQPPSPPI